MMSDMGRGTGMTRGMRPGMRNGMAGMHQGMGMGMRRGMGSMPGDSIGWMPMGPGRRMLESIPNVTENQKKQITELMKKHQDEMKKLQEETLSKMQSLRDSHKKDMLNILTDEQKKYIESGREKSTPDQNR
jgi:Spy/CpxP family protein refolding chaperone